MPDASYPMTARSTSRSRASCCCPCCLASVVTVAAGTRWGDSTPCYASHHMMFVLLCVLKNYVFRQRYTVFWPYTICRPNTKTKISRTSGQTDRRSVFFFLDVAIRNSLRSNKNPMDYYSYCLKQLLLAVQHICALRQRVRSVCQSQQKLRYTTTTYWYDTTKRII